MREGHLLIADHSRRHLRAEHYFPGPVLERANLARWRAEGARTLRERARAEVERLVGEAPASPLPDAVQGELTRLMTAAAAAHGLDALPAGAA